MTAAPNPAPMTLEDWFALGEDESLRWAELCRGVLEVSPGPRRAHSGAVLAIASALGTRSADGYEIYQQLDVVLESRPATVRQPDLVIIRADAPEPLHAADVVLAIEIVSPGSARLDRVVKRDEYAAAGIPHYWIIDLDGGPSAEVLTLVDGRYEGATVTGRIAVGGTPRLVLDLAVLSPSSDPGRGPERPA